MAIKMTEQVRRHLKDVLKDDDTEYGGTAFEGETVEDFMSEVYDETDHVVTLETLNESLKDCGICPVADNEELNRRLENLWSRYLSYLRTWTDGSGFTEHFGESPMSYSDWCGTQKDVAV